MQSKRIYQLGLFLATAGASLLLSGAAHADGGDVTSTSQANQSTSNQQVVVSDQSTTTSSVKETQKVSGQTAATDSSQPPATASPSAQGQDPSASSPIASPIPTAATGAQPASQPSSVPMPVPVTFFRPVTIIAPLIPTFSQTDGVVTVTMPIIAPAKPYVPAPPVPSGALSNVTQALGQTTLPLGGNLLLHSVTHQGWPVPHLSLGLMMAIMAISTFASLLRRWGYAISARGSDPRLQLAYEFASPAMSELVPVRTMYPG